MSKGSKLTDNRRFNLGQEGLPDLPLMMLMTLEALKRLGGSGTINEVTDDVVEGEGITEEEQEFLMPNGRERRLYYYLSWARTFLKRGGALENSSRGVWALTENGEKISSIDETRTIHQQVNDEEKRRSKAKRDQAKAKQKEVEARKQPLLPGAQDDASPLDDLYGGHSEGENWKDRLLSELSNLEPSGFERLSQRLLREAGFVKVEVRGKSHDGGIDGVGILRVNLVTFQVYFQCKKWSGSVGSKEIRDFRGALQGRADKGLFITTSTFTKQASEEATRDGAIAIDLIDGDRLCDLLKQYELGVKTEVVERVTIQSQWLAEI